MFDALVIDVAALNFLEAAIFDEQWFEEFGVPSSLKGIRRITHERNIYIFSDNADESSGLLVMRIDAHGVFENISDRRVLFERATRVALRHFDRNISLPLQWQSYHFGRFLSVYAEPILRQSTRRLCFDQNPGGTNHLFAFGIQPIVTEIRDDEEARTIFKKSIDGLIDALLQEKPREVEAGNFGIVLSDSLGARYSGQILLEEWLNHRLNEKQLNFVKEKTVKPIRLRGAAGTGKTQAMAVKCLHDLYKAPVDNVRLSFGFLTHSSSLAHEVIFQMFSTMDPDGKWLSLRDEFDLSRLWVGTLYELAQERLSYLQKGLKPLSLDGREGKELQRILIDDALRIVREDARLVLTHFEECRDFVTLLTSPLHRPALIEDLMNEFACSLDADTVTKGTASAERYLSNTRETWQMKLRSRGEREIVLEVYDTYQKLLKREKLLSMDQMVADFSRYLVTHEWNQLRDRHGFDVIFVDEYHYFTRVETMLLHNLFKNRAEHDGRWPLIMAYDLKQSVVDNAFGGGISRFKNPGVGESTPLDLTQVYRSTPQITEFLRDLDGCFPAIDLEGEFQAYVGRSGNEDGDAVRLLGYATNIAMVDAVFSMAAEASKSAPNKGADVAILCLNEALFDTYRKAGRYTGKHIPVVSREDFRELRYAKSKFVFSMPEYVAGLQFDSVYIIHADNAEVSDNDLGHGARRRLVSQIYLGSSRARTKLLLAFSEERGGLCPVLFGPKKSGSLKAAV